MSKQVESFLQPPKMKEPSHLLASTSTSNVPFQNLHAQWIPINSSSDNTQPNLTKPSRSGHVSFTMNDNLFIFGGYAEVEEIGSNGDVTLKRFPINDLWERKKVDIRKNDNDSDKNDICDHIWELVEQQGDVPEERLVSAASVLDGRAYLFGGWNPNQQQSDGNVILDTIHSYDSETKTWTKLECTIPDGPTSRHITIPLPSQTKALLHNHRCDGFVYIFDSKSQSFSKQKTTGTPPSSRGLHAACVLGNSHLLLFGGADKSGFMSNETFLLDLNTWIWSKLDLDDDDDNCANIPNVRAAPCLVSFDESRAILYGGAQAVENVGLVPLDDVWALYIDKVTNKGKWELLNTGRELNDDEYPPGRNAATMDEISVPFSFKEKYDRGNGEKWFLLYGGWAPFRKTWNDAFVLKVRNEQ